MKQKLLYIILIIFCAFAWSDEAWGETTQYVVSPQGSSEIEIENRWSSSTDKVYSWDGPGKTLKFDYRTQWSALGEVEVYGTDTNGKETKLNGYGNNSSWNTQTIELNENIRKIRFHGSSTERKYIRNVEITRATTLSFSSSDYTTSSTTLTDFGNVLKGSSSSKKTAIFYFNNTLTDRTLSVTSSSSEFVVDNTSFTLGASGNKTIGVTFKPTSVGKKTGTITLTLAKLTANGITVDKKEITISVSGTGTINYTFAATASPNSATCGSASATLSRTSVTSSNISETATATFTADANDGYEFQGWGTSSSSTSYENTDNPYAVTLTATEAYPSQSKTLYAIFKPVFNFTATAKSSNETLGTATGSVTPKFIGNVGATSYTTTATFTAEPKTDCVFLGWFTSNSYTGNPISTELSHTETLTSTIGTPGTKTLYALFRKKQNLKWVDDDLDLNLVLGASDLSSAASVTSNKTISYTSSNENALTIAVDGSITTVGLGSSIVTAHVDGDDTYIEETITREFNVGERKQATFTPSWGESLTTDIELGETATITLRNVNSNFSVTKGEGNYFSWERTNSSTITITALSAGSTTLTLSQPSDGAYLDGNTTTYTINVVKHPNTFALAAESKAMKVGEDWTNVVTNTGNNNTQVSYSDDDIATYDATNNKITAIAEGSTTITFTQAATTTYAGITKTIDVTVTKVTNTLSISLPSLETEVDGSIALSIENKNNPASIVANITEEHQTSGVNNGTGVISFNATSNVITGLNAGTAKITFSQPSTDKYTASQSYTFDITVNKVANAITIKLNNEQKNSLNVARGDQVALSYTSPSSGAYHVALTSGSAATANISGNTITAGTTDGTNIWTISQDETYKYEAATATVRIKVNSVAEAEGYVYTGWTEGNEYSWSTIDGTDALPLSGPGEYFTFEAKRTAILGFTNTTNFYAQYSTDGGINWKTALTINIPESDKWYQFTCPDPIPENTTHVRLLTETGATGGKQVRNVKVTRKTYVRSAADNKNLGEVFTNKTASTTFTIDYSSTNGGNLEITSNNPRFSVDVTSVTVANNSDNVGSPKSIIVTYTPDPDHLGTDNGTITVSDRYYSADLTFTATAKKYTTTMARGLNDATETTVDGIIDNAFAFTGTSATYPSDDSNTDFYYTISHTQTSSFNKGADVISYDPSTNTVTGKNQGTARLTIYQKKTDLYNATSQTFDFSVTKLENNTVMSLSTKTLSVDGTATVELMNADSDGTLSATYSNISYLNESQNRDGGLLSFAGNTLTGVNAGTGKVTITQAETYKYVAKSQEFNVTVNKLTQTLSWDNPDLETTMQVGTSLEGNTATSDAGLTPVTYSSGNASAITVDANTGVLTAVTTGSNIGVTASQAGNYKYLPATLTRQFSVFNKQTPAFNADSHFSGSTGRIEYTLTATITVTGVSDGVNGDFTITNGDNTIIDVVRNGETITITGLKEGSTTLTLAQTANDDYLAKTQTYNIEVYWPDDFLALSPTEEPKHAAKTCRKVFFNRSLKAGYSTLSLPFNTTVQNIVGTGYNAANDWVAQLSVVTYNAQDGYSLYFEKKSEIIANQPYILHLGAEVDSPVFTNISVVAAVEGTQNATKGVNANQWILHANYNPTFEMDGYYGVVGEKIKKGTEGSSLKAYHAYIEGPTVATVRAAYLDDDEADGLLELIRSEQDEVAGQQIYDLQGRKLSREQRGINIVVRRDGKVTKVLSTF
jgi:hypothetical protein